jgi:hypothetical protein
MLGTFIGSVVSASAEESKACFSKICIRATLDQIPKNLKWEIIRPMTSLAGYKAWEEILPRDMIGPPTIIQQLKPYRTFGGMPNLINSKVIDLLKQVHGTCVPFSTEGHFKSDSGHDTLVQVHSYPNQDGSAQTFKVAWISRNFESIRSDEDEERLAQELEIQFGVPVKRYPSGLYHGREPRNDEPKVYFSSISEVVIVPSHDDEKIDLYTGSLFARLPGCSKVQAIE